MRTALSRSRFRLAGILVVLLVALAVATTLASGAPTAHRAPTAHQARAVLVLTSRHPATVRGTGFKPNTPVRVALLAAHPLVRHPVTNSKGTFTTSFPVLMDSCSDWSIVASQPGRAPVMLRLPEPMCAVAPATP